MYKFLTSDYVTVVLLYSYFPILQTKWKKIINEKSCQGYKLLQAINRLIFLEMAECWS